MEGVKEKMETRRHATGEPSESSCGAGPSLRRGEQDRDRFIGGSDDILIRFTEGSQSAQSEQYESSLAHGDMQRREAGDDGREGEWVSSGTSVMAGGVFVILGGTVSLNLERTRRRYSL